MTYYYDNYGWLTATPNGRSTGITPPTETAELKANFTGIDWVLVPYVAPPVIVPSTPAVRRLSKLGFVGRLGADFASILTAAKANVGIEMFVRMLDWATPDADGTSVDLDDPRVIGALQALELAGIIAPGRAAEILA